MNHFLPFGRKNLADAFAKSIFPCNLMVLLLKGGMTKIESERSAAWFSAFDWGSKGREFESLRSDHSFSTRHSGLYPRAFLFVLLRLIFEGKTPRCLYRRRFRGNPAAPKFLFRRFIHSVFQSSGTLSTAPLLQPWIQPFADILHMYVLRQAILNRVYTELQNLLHAVYGFTFVLESKVFCLPIVQILQFWQVKLIGNATSPIGKQACF